MTLAIGSLTIGLILSLLAFGILMSFRVVAFEDLTVDGSLALGGATTATLIVTGWHPIAATLSGALAGGLAGSVTAILNTKFDINRLLSGILVMTALYSINLRILGKSNIPLRSDLTIMKYSNWLATQLSGQDSFMSLGLWQAPATDVTAMIMMLVIALTAGGILAIFFRTNCGLAMQAVGDNNRMTRALGVDVKRMTILALFVGNAMIATAGSLLAQYQGFADIQMGIGMLVWGVASVILGESLVGTKKIGFLIAGALMGSVLFRLLVAIALRWGLNPNDLKLITALFVFAALVLPKILSGGSSLVRGRNRA
ncbi:MAG: ABC transporter permease [Fuerstiella sp.]|jgi:putative ABC transport system permease protein|nr:ABC transporter permease [Fuerstiella sp.]MDG2130310.1 ABC transporter permease [Fuerstiella sp.]